MDDMIKEKLALKELVDSLEQNLSKQIKEKECLLHTFTNFKNESKEKEDKYMENEIELEKKIKEFDNILFKVGQSAQTVLIKPSDALPVKIEAPKELPKISLVNESLKSLNSNLDVHIKYLKYAQEQADILRGIVKQAKAKQPLGGPTGHVFTEVGFKWKPRGRTFTIVGNLCPLTRFTLANVVPPKKTTSHSVETQKTELKVYSRKPKNVKNVGTSKKAKIVESKNANHSEPNHTWGSNATDIPSSSFLVMIGCPDCSLVSGLRCFVSKTMTGNRSQLTNFVSKFMGTVRFRNDHVARIMGYGDYQLGNVTISRVYYVEGLGHNLFSVGLRAGYRHCRFLSSTSGKSKKSSHQPKAEDTNQEKLYLLHMDLCGPIRVSSINRKKIKKLDLSFFHVFGALCYPTNDNDDLGKLDAKADIGIFVGYAPAKKAFRIYNKRTRKIIETVHLTFDELTIMASKQFSSGPELHSMTPATSSSGLVPNTVSQQPCIPPNRDDWDHLFQPMFDEYFTPPSNVVSPVQEAAALRAVDLADSPVSTSIDQDAPSSSTPSTQERHNSIISQEILLALSLRESNSKLMPYGIILMPNLTSVEPKNFKQAITEPSWIDAMQEEIQEFQRLKVWELVPCPDKVLLIKLKWIFKVKTDKFDGVLKNKAKLVAQGFRQEEGIDFKESFASDNPSHVYKLKKALYGLKQAPRAWYDMLSSFLISQHFSKGAVDPTLFTRQAGNDLLLVQIYVDDIIFASTNTAMCNEFANQMTTKFKMSMMGQMSFFLGLQISQSPRGIFINQSKYASEIVKKYGMLTTDSVDKPLVEKSILDEDLQGKQVDATLYRGMIGSLMYLTSSRPDLIHAVCLCARYQAKPTEKHLQAVKRIF
ncbi:retrovirus-related pol polyprotein from transposon TNT 1-94 [Tanacetum coccineum]